MAVETPSEKKSVPDGLWRKCDGCHELIYNKDLENNFMVCPKCNYYFKLNVNERINMLVEPGSFKEMDGDILPQDPLEFKDTKSYVSRIKNQQKKTGHADAVITGSGKIGNNNVILAVMDFDFMGGSMGSVVGEKITRAIEKATKKKVPIVIVSASGGARMQEGIFSLMQMAKTSAAISLHGKERIPFISVMIDPTSGGVTASFAMLGDINIAEPNAFIGFAGPIVIEQTIRQKLPAHFQKSEFQLDHGMIDMIIERKDLKNMLEKILNLLNKKK